ncbi:hypothetical protein B0J17DRAFT_290284 [Rhizoctonia solani]|nr:hypothetical protein B0J17DRAFT_290284 [Rhizoctonia solani]
MRARISQLEAELDSARASRDKAISKKGIIRVASQAAQRVSRESVTEKIALDAALSLGKVKHDQLRAELEATLLYGPSTREDEGKQKMAHSCACQHAGHNERVAALKRELKENQDRHTRDQEKAQLNATELNEAKSTIQQLKYEFKRSQSDLSFTQEQLESTKQLLESTEQNYVSILEEHERTKEKLETYKTWLENEQTLMQKLEDTLIPEVYKSLGATQATLGAFLSAMGLLQAKEQGDIGPQQGLD